MSKKVDKSLKSAIGIEVDKRTKIFNALFNNDGWSVKKKKVKKK